MNQNAKAALITGGSSGIGKAFAHLLAKEGYTLILIAHEQTLLETVAFELKQKYSIEVFTLAIDLSQPQAAEYIFQYIQINQWPIHILINNAGFGLVGNFITHPLQQIRAMMSVNMNALVELTYLLLPQMMKEKSAFILNTASTAAFQPGPGMAIYFATKAFIHSFSQALHAELKDTGISVTSLLPGPTKTNFATTANMMNNPIHQGIVPLWEPEGVALWGLKAMKRKKRVAIVGWINLVLSYIACWVPTSMVMKSIKKLHQSFNHL